MLFGERTGRKDVLKPLTQEIIYNTMFVIYLLGDTDELTCPGSLSRFAARQLDEMQWETLLHEHIYDRQLH